MYRGTRDGFKSESFRKLCGKRGSTLTIAKSGTNIFGGFTDIPWSIEFPLNEGIQMRGEHNSYIFKVLQTD